MKIEISEAFPEHFRPAYPEEFELFSHFETTAGIPSPLFAITTWKENGLPNVCFHAWSCFHGDKTAFFAVMGNLYQHTHTYANILREKCFALNFLPIACYDRLVETIRRNGMDEDEFAALPFGSEGLWQKVMHACRTEASLEGILAAAKSKRYPRTRLMRMLLCGFLGLTEQQLAEPAPYVRVLALDTDGRAILRAAQGGLSLLHAGERAQDCAFAETERRCRALYGLFRENGPAEPVPKSRVYVQRD